MDLIGTPAGDVLTVWRNGDGIHRLPARRQLPPRTRRQHVRAVPRGCALVDPQLDRSQLFGSQRGSRDVVVRRRHERLLTVRSQFQQQAVVATARCDRGTGVAPLEHRRYGLQNQLAIRLAGAVAGEALLAEDRQYVRLKADRRTEFRCDRRDRRLSIQRGGCRQRGSQQGNERRAAAKQVRVHGRALVIRGTSGGSCGRQRRLVGRTIVSRAGGSRRYLVASTFSIFSVTG